MLQYIAKITCGNAKLGIIFHHFLINPLQSKIIVHSQQTIKQQTRHQFRMQA